MAVLSKPYAILYTKHHFSLLIIAPHHLTVNISTSAISCEEREMPERTGAGAGNITEPELEEGTHLTPGGHRAMSVWPLCHYYYIQTLNMH